jgi:hypothetical protein
MSLRPAAQEWRISGTPGTWHGSCWTGGTGTTPSGRDRMERFESFAFAIGFIATGLLTLVAQVTIV